MKRLALTLFAALYAGGVVQHPWCHYSNATEHISFDLPSSWQVQSEGTLEKIGYLVPPYPAYTMVAGAEPATLAGVPNPPSGYAFSETPSPWFSILVETGTSPALPPDQAYKLAPEAELILQRSAGLDPQVMGLTPPVRVSSGGLHGSQDRSEVVVAGAGDVELDEVVYVKGHTVWMVMSGCTVACFKANSVTVSQVINSVRVGTAAQPGAKSVLGPKN